MSKFQRLEMRSFAFLYSCRGDWEQNGPYCRYIFEPLDEALDFRITNRMYCPYGRVPADAVAWCCYGDTIQFLKNGVEIARARYHQMVQVSPVLVLMPDDIWFEVTGGRCEYRDDQWMMIWRAYRNTRHAHMMNHGFPVYLDPDIRKENEALRKGCQAALDWALADSDTPAGDTSTLAEKVVPMLDEALNMRRKR